jgi:hypothetical protein
MIYFREPDEIKTWLVVFHERAATWWVNWLVPGRFKHVSAFGYSVKARTWVFFDPQITYSRIVILPDGSDAERRMAEYTADAAVLKIDHRPSRVRFRPVLCCTSMISHMLGLPGGALLPDRLWSHCLRNGAEIVHGNIRRSPIAAAADGRSCAGAATG